MGIVRGMVSGLESGLSRSYSFTSVAVTHPIHLGRAIGLESRLSAVGPPFQFSYAAHAAQSVALESGFVRPNMDIDIQLQSEGVPSHYVARISIAAAKRNPDRILAWLGSDKISAEAKTRILGVMSENRLATILNAADDTLAPSLLALVPAPTMAKLLERRGEDAQRRTMVAKMPGPKLGEALSDPAVSTRTITEVLMGYSIEEDKKREIISNLSGEALRHIIRQGNFYVPATDRYAELIAAHLNAAAMARALAQGETWSPPVDKRDKFIKFLAELTPDKMAEVFKALLGESPLDRELAYAALTLYVLLRHREAPHTSKVAQAFSIIARTDLDKIAMIFAFNDNIGWESTGGGRGRQTTKYVPIEVRGLSEEMAVSILRQMEAGLAERVLAEMTPSEKTGRIKRAMGTT